MPLKLNIGDIIELRKQHPCGGKMFEVLRVGMDFRIRCLNCGSQMRIARPKLEKSIVKIHNSLKSSSDQRPTSE